METIQAVVFDMDGVLFDTERLYLEEWRQIAAEEHIAPEVMERAILGCVGLNNTDTRALFQSVCGERFPFDEAYKKCSDRMKERVKREGLPMKPGVREILYYLRAAGYRIALASSTRTESVLRHLEQAQIRDCFEVVTGGDRVEHSKPLPDIYLITCRELGVSPQNAVAIEDSPNGIRSAYAAGMHPIMVPDLIAPTPEIQKLLYAECKTLLEVLDLFKETAARDGLQEVLRIPLQGLCNTRDLGGYRTADGRRIKKHRLLRSGALFDATPEDLETLCSEYDLRKVVDFRTSSERAGKPDPKLPGVSYVENPILQEAMLGITREEDQGQDCNAVVRKVVNVLESDGNTPLSYMENMYSNLITNPFSKGQYRKFFEILEEQKEGALLWHCSAGKDRVGVATILLLTALGVPRRQILADYEKVNCFVAKDVAQLMETLTEGMDPAARETAVRREALRLLFTVNGAYAESVFAAMERQSGSTEAFLEEEMGLTPERLQSLRDNYLE